MSTGLVLGKFYPPHAGHHYLIDEALKRVDQLIVLIWWSETESISGYHRRQILKEVHPDAIVIEQQCEIMPDYESEDVWQEHMHLFFSGLPSYKPLQGTEKFDYVFTSEDYGDELARQLDAKHVSIDFKREHVPISGTAIRENPAAHWNHLAEPTRALLTKRFVITGAESTGSTTLTKSLAQHYGTVWVPEYGRLYTQGTKVLNAQWTENEFVHIATEQSAIEDFMSRKAGPVMFCDTDALSTGVWHERYQWSRSKAVEAIAADRKYEHYFITDYEEVPLEQDGTRDGTNEIRAWMQNRLTQRITESKYRRSCILGGPKMRIAHTVDIVDGYLDSGWNLAPPLGG